LHYPPNFASGAHSEIIVHEHEPFVAEFPAQVFLQGGERKRVERYLGVGSMLRLRIDGKMFAYSYGLSPIEAHREHGAWKIDSEAACLSYVTFIDDVGDGVFRQLVNGPLTDALIPAWVRRPHVN
jgi:hypothetical protein